LSPAKEEAFIAYNVSLCAQALATDVPGTMGFEQMIPFSFGLEAACNGGDMYSMLLDRIPGICPQCQETSDCTEEDIILHAQEFCIGHCQENLNVSLYPDLSRTTAYDSGAYGCPRDSRYFIAPEPLEPTVCDPEGNLSQLIVLQPVISNGISWKASMTSIVCVLTSFAWLL
jgi:hypothetical protein